MCNTQNNIFTPVEMCQRCPIWLMLIIFLCSAMAQLDLCLPIWKFLEEFYQFFGLATNPSKSLFVTGSRNPNTATKIQACTGFQRESIPFMYLGSPMYNGTTRRTIYNSILNKINDRLHRWQGKILSPGAKLTLINSILQTLPLYYMSIIDPPLSLLRTIARLIINFFWHDNEGTKMYHWLSLENLYRVKEEGLGIRKFSDTTKAFSYKLRWGFRGSVQSEGRGGWE